MPTTHDDAVSRARILAEAMTLVRDLVNTAPADMVPADLAAAAEQAAAEHGLGVQVLDENELAKEGFGGILAVGMGSSTRRGWSGSSTPTRTPTAPWCSWARASRSTPAASRSSRRRRWRR